MSLLQSSCVQSKPKQDQTAMEHQPRITSLRPTRHHWMHSQPQPPQSRACRFCWSIPLPKTAPHCELYKMLLVLIHCWAPTTSLTHTYTEGNQKSGQIHGMQTLSISPWQQWKCLYPFLFALIQSLWWRAGISVFEHHVLTLCTVWECVHICLWLHKHMQICRRNIVQLQNCRFVQ